MKKGIFSLMMGLILAFTGLANAQNVVEIGTGTTTTSAGAFNSIWGYTFAETLYPASEIGMAGTITHLAYHINSTATYHNEVVFYMKNVSTTAFNSASDVVPVTTADIVYQGAFDFPATSGWYTIELDTPFEYDGVSTLMIACDENAPGYSSRDFYYTNVTNCRYSYYSDSANPDPYNLGAFSGNSGTGYYRSNIQLTMQTGPATVSIVVTPNPIEMDARPNNCWMRPMTVSITNEGGATNITGIDFDNNYFTPELGELVIPFAIAHNETVDFAVSTGSGNGDMVGILDVDAGDLRTAFLTDIHAYAYEPVCPDVWELARVISNVNDYRDTPTTVTLYNNYVLPPASVEDGIDAVYKVTFDHDVMLNGNVTKPGTAETAENGKLVVYTQAGIDEVGGPDLNNYYTGPSIGSEIPMEMTAFAGGATTTGYLPMYGFYADAYTRSQYVIPATEIAAMAGCPINSLTYYTASTPANWNTTFKVYLTEVNFTSMTNFIDPATATTVYTGALSIVDGQMVVTFDTPYQYNGGNLLIGMDCLAPGTYSSCYFQAVAMTGAGLYAYNYSAPSFASGNAVPYAPTTTFGYMGRNANRDGNVLTYDFEDGLQGWTSIDADGDGRGWMTISDYCYGIAHTGSNGAVSASYDMCGEYGYIAFNANNYLVSPQKYAISEGSKLNFWFDDAGVTYSAPDYFEVCVSTAGNTSASDFTAVWNSGRTRSNGTRDGRGTRSYGTWREVEVDLSAYAGQEIYIAFHHQQYDGYDLWIDDVTIDLGGTPVPPVPGDQLITNMTMLPGTYYIAASSTEAAWDVVLNATELPCPDVAYNPTPADDADGITPSAVTLKWKLGQYTTEYRLRFGTTYYCEDILVDWTTDLAESFTVTNLFNNTNYFWRVEERNAGCPEGVAGPVWGFTTTFNAPTNLHSTNTNGNNLYEGETLHLAWNAIVDRTFRSYNIYMDDELIGSTPSNPNPTATTTFDVDGLSYNLDGYVFYVTAVYDEGESGTSNYLFINVSGEGEVDGYVYEQDGTTGIANATVTKTGRDEFNRTRTYTFTTDANGHYHGAMLAGQYSGVASCPGYQDVQYVDNPFEIVYDRVTPDINYIMDEVYTPVAEVIAEYYPDPEDPESPYVKVYWGWNIMSAMIEDFETGDFSQYDWNIPAQYPFEITTNNPYEGAYCMQSTNYNVASSTSSIDVTVEIPRDGLMSFYKRISCESSWDMAYFYIDGAQVATFTGTSGWGVKEVAVTEGTHNFKWAYTKDGSVNSGEDRFFIDYIDFCHDAQPVGAGWHTYLEGEFDNAYVSNVGTPSWGYEYPASVISSYAGMTMTKVALFSDDMYGAVGGTFTCKVYQGGATPAAGTLVSSITVDVPAGVGDWVEFDLTTPVSVNNDPLYVLWTADVIGGLGYPAGCASHPSTYGDWWNNGQDGWQHMGECTWTMKNYFSDRSGRGFWASNAEANQAIQPVSSLDSHLRTYAKGEEANSGAVCINPNATFKATSNSNDRSFQYFRVYRTDCYNEGPYTEENTVVCCCELHDTLYIDVEWPELAPGVYKWGVGCVYGGNRGELVESPIAWANVNVPQAYDRDAAKLVAEQNHAEISCKEYVNAEGTRAPWDLMGSMNAYEAAQYGVATDGNNIYTCNWGYGSATYNFCKYDMQGNFVEGFNIAGCGTIRDLDYDGQYFYGGANGSTLYCMDLANHTLVSTISTGCSAIRHCSYDPQNDGFWVGGWSDLMLINRNGQVIANAPAPSSCGGSGYYTAEDGSAHLYLWCEPQSVYDYDIAANSINYINNLTNIPGWDGSSTAGGAFVGEYNGKIAFFCNIQQDPNLIGIFELRDAGTPGPDPQGDPIQEPRESPIVWSNCLDKDMYLNGAVDITVLLNSADSPEGTTVAFRNLNEYEQELYPVETVTLDSTGYYVWDSFRRGEYEVTISHDGYETITEEVNIMNATSLRYVMIEIIYGVSDLYVSHTGWAMWAGEGPTPVPPHGDEFTFGFEEDPIANGWTIQQLNETSWVRQEGATGFGAAPHEGNYQMWLHWAYGDQDEWLITPEFTVPANGNLNFWTYATLGSTYGDHYYAKITVDGGNTWNVLWDATAQPAGTNYYTSPINCDLSAYAGQTAKIAWQGVMADGLWYAWCIDDITVSGGREVISFDGRQWFRQETNTTEVGEPVAYSKAGDVEPRNGERHLEGYKVLCTSIDGEPIFSGNTVHPFIQVDTDELVEGENYICKVAAIYSTGMSDWTVAEWQYKPCDYYGEAQDVEAEGNTVNWNYPSGPVPPPPGPGDEWSYSFDTGFDGWTTIDADGDGHNWYHSTEAGNHGTAAVTSHSGAGHLMSESYCNATYAALSPDEYVVSPASSITNGSTFSFWVCAQDASYAAEHYGVAVSTDGTAFTTIEEWTLTAKGGVEVDPAATRDGRNNREGNWYQKTVDLSNYAGQNLYIAVRHFNCSDQFILLLDDAELSIGAKSSRDEYIQYCTETFSGGVGTGGGEVWWAVKFPASSLAAYAGQSISKLGCFTDVDGDYGWTYSGNYELSVFAGTSAPTTLLGGTGMQYVAGDLAWHDLELPTAVAIDGTQDLWIVGHTTDIAYPMSGCDYVGDANSDYLSLDNSTWEHAGDYGLAYTWMLRAFVTGGSPVPPEPTGEVLGAMIFRDGEWLAEVPYPTNSYTDEEAYGEHEYCVRIIYNGTNILPDQNEYYSMSCPVCVGGDLTCEPGAPIRGEYVWNNANDFGALISWGEQAEPIAEWLYYDNGTNEDAIGLTGGGSFYWGIMIPSSQLGAYAGCSLTKVSLFDYTAHTGKVIIYQGGSNAPGTPIHQDNYTMTGSSNYVEVALSAALPIDPSQNLWIVFNNNDGDYVASCCANTGDANGRWISLDGASWEDVASYGLSNTWQIRGYVTNMAKGAAVTAIEAPALNGTPNGILTNAGISKQGNRPAFANRAEIVKYNIYRSTDNVNYELIGSVDAIDGTSYYEYFDATAAGMYYYQVRALYSNGCESEPAASEANPANNYVIVVVTSVAENGEIALYPNPTNGNITIQAQNMNRITVVSVLGQVVYDAEVEGEQQIINMAQFNAGVYMVRIATENGVSTQRVTVVK